MNLQLVFVNAVPSVLSSGLAFREFCANSGTCPHKEGSVCPRMLFVDDVPVTSFDAAYTHLGQSGHDGALPLDDKIQVRANPARPYNYLVFPMNQAKDLPVKDVRKGVACIHPVIHELPSL